MRMYDMIHKKKKGKALNKEEIEFIVTGFVQGEIPASQMSALLMAICINGMNKEETAFLTLTMAHSGDIVDLSSIDGIKVDKHSTGGVGDKTTLVVSPLVAALGIPVAKMSGRGLGHTGGTVDKLESIPGFQTNFSRDEFLSIVNETGVCVAGQSGNLAPADKKIYALRDITATVDSIPLIAASVMSKKIAAGADKIVLDVKTGSGAFMKTLEGSIELAQTMVAIGESVGKQTVALITDMDVPLGNAIGNALEVIEVVETLRGKGPADLTEACLLLAREMLCLAGKGSLETCYGLAKDAIASGAAYNKFIHMVGRQGGQVEWLQNVCLFPTAAIVEPVPAPESGYIRHMDAEACGIASALLGAGRELEDGEIDYAAGIILLAKTGDYVKKGDPVAFLHTARKDKLNQGKQVFSAALSYSENKPEAKSLVYARVDINGVEKYE